MAAPTVTCLIDWDLSGDFAGAYDLVSPLSGPSDPGIRTSRGASADFGSEMVGELSFVLDNVGRQFDRERNLLDNPSFERATVAPWTTDAIPSLIAAATSLSIVVDHATGTGTHAGEASLSATVNSGIFIPIRYRFRAGVVHSGVVWLKSMSGNLHVRAGLASAGTPADIASSSADITSGWVAYPWSWTPSVDRDDAGMFIRTTTAAAAVVRVDAGQVNVGAAANAYLEAPTFGELRGGRPCLVYATSGGNTALFSGRVQRLTPDQANLKVRVVVNDVLKVMGKTDVVVPPSLAVGLTARQYRLAILEDFERGDLNHVANPEFAVDLTGWGGDVGHLARITTDAPPGLGVATAGSWTPAAANEQLVFPLRRSAVYYADEWYVVAGYAKFVSGVNSFWLGMSDPTVSQLGFMTDVGAGWKRFYWAVQMSADAVANSLPPAVILKSFGAGTIRISALSVTRGQSIYPYSRVGSGRWRNLMGYAGEVQGGGAGIGWLGAFANQVPNPSFEVDASSWVATADAFHVAGGAITRVAGAAPGGGGAWHGEVASGGAGGGWGMHTVLPGTYVSGETYLVTGLAGLTNAAFHTIRLGVGSQGTPTDFIDATQATGGAAGFWPFSVTWIPTGNRSDAHLFVSDITATDPGGAIELDRVMVLHLTGTGTPAYMDTGPGGGGSAPTSINSENAVVKYGSGSMKVVTPAVAGAGVFFPFRSSGAAFDAGFPFMERVWIRATTAMPYRIGIGGLAADGSWDEVSATGTLTANVWTQVDLPSWTPAALRSDSFVDYHVGLYIEQTNATGRTFYIGHARVIPGSVMDEPELPQWAIPGSSLSGTLSGAGLKGDVISCLKLLADLDLARTWIEPTLTPPYWEFHAEDYAAFAAKAPVWTFTETIDDWSNLDLDNDSIVNTLVYRLGGGSPDRLYADPSGRPVVDAGPQPAASIDASLYAAGGNSVDLWAAALLYRYSVPRLRPTVVVKQEFAAFLAVHLNDVIALTKAVYLMSAMPFVVLRADLVIRSGALEWTMTWTLEEYPY